VAIMEAPADPRARRLFGGSARAAGDLAASPFRADRDRIVSSPFFARLAGVTQVISPGGSGLLVHNRLTHSLKVAQVARAIAERLTADERYRSLLDSLGGCDPEVVEAAALAHDLGHPPFGHLGERVLDRLARGSAGASMIATLAHGRCRRCGHGRRPGEATGVGADRHNALRNPPEKADQDRDPLC